MDIRLVTRSEYEDLEKGYSGNKTESRGNVS